MGRDRKILAATLLMLGAVMLNALDTLLVRVLTHDLHPFVIVFFRSFFGLLFVLPWGLRYKSALKSHYSFLHLLRALLKMLSFAAFFTAIAAAGLADVTAIAFTTPVFVTLGAWLFLHERLLASRIIACLIGFAGVLLIVRPGAGGFSGVLLLALGGAVLAAIIQLMLKRMSARDSTETLVAWNLILTVPLSAIPLLWFWTAPNPEQLAVLAFQGGAGALGMTCITRAMALAPASYLAPVDFVRLPVVAGLAYFFFSEIPTAASMAGAALILGATLIVTARARE